MVSAFPGWSVVRNIPTQHIEGLVTGKYKLCGGVVRWAKGTGKGGQVVCHLVNANPISAGIDLVKAGIEAYKIIKLDELSGQMDNVSSQINEVSSQVRGIADQVTSLTGLTQQLLQVSTNTMLLSGLNLTVSMTSFAVLSKKLDGIKKQLEQVHVDVKEIKNIIERRQHAELQAAIDNLARSDFAVDNRFHIINGARERLSVFLVEYSNLLKQQETIKTALVYEELFCVTALAHARCYAEMKEPKMANKELAKAVDIWKLEAQRIVKDILLRGNPERFLYSDFAQQVPINALVEWLDFAYGENKGYDWLDELRLKMPSHYKTNKNLVTVNSLIKTQNSKKRPLNQEKDDIIPALYRLVARNSIFQGYLSQYEFFEEQKLTPSEFERLIEALPPTERVDDYIILEKAESWDEYRQGLFCSG